MLSVTVQHHPRRAHLLDGLLAALAEPVEVTIDPEPRNPHFSPWRCYRHALATTPPEATHRLILQDDTTVCRNFLPAARLAVEAQPDRVILFYVGGQPVDYARLICRAAGLHPFVAVLANRWCPVVATCWPSRLIGPCLEWTEAQRWPPAFRADDEIAGRYLRHAGEEILATAPSLVDHDDVEPSLIGLRAKAGRDRSRVAACFIGECDPLTIDWHGEVLTAARSRIRG